MNEEVDLLADVTTDPALESRPVGVGMEAAGHQPKAVHAPGAHSPMLQAILQQLDHRAPPPANPTSPAAAPASTLGNINATGAATMGGATVTPGQPNAGPRCTNNTIGTYHPRRPPNTTASLVGIVSGVVAIAATTTSATHYHNLITQVFGHQNGIATQTIPAVVQCPRSQKTVLNKVTSLGLAGHSWSEFKLETLMNVGF